MKNTTNYESNRYHRYERILEIMMKLINTFKDYETEPREYGTDELFYSLEIHTIHVIGKNSELNLTEIANWLGISKSAVSKVVKKLDMKGAIHRYKAPNNMKEVLFELTERGQKAYIGHLEHHKKQEESLFNMLETLSDEKLQNAEEVLLIFDEYSKKLIK